MTPWARSRRDQARLIYADSGITIYPDSSKIIPDL